METGSRFLSRVPTSTTEQTSLYRDVVQLPVRSDVMMDGDCSAYSPRCHRLLLGRRQLSNVLTSRAPTPLIDTLAATSRHPTEVRTIQLGHFVGLASLVKCNFMVTTS